MIKSHTELREFTKKYPSLSTNNKFIILTACFINILKNENYLYENEWGFYPQRGYKWKEKFHVVLSREVVI
jgi:hypothetical protein